MLNIVLVCQFGASTGMLAENIKLAAQARGLEAAVNAYGVAEIASVSKNADVVLIGPQMRFQQQEFETKYDQVPFLSINPLDYGMMNGEKVLDSALKKIEEFKKRGE